MEIVRSASRTAYHSPLPLRCPHRHATMGLRRPNQLESKYSAEKTADKSIVGFIRIRSRSQGLALSLGSLKGLVSVSRYLQTSYSTNDVPTVKKSLTPDPVLTPSNIQADQQFHNHNVSLGGIPANAVNNRQSREAANVATKIEDKFLVPILNRLHLTRNFLFLHLRSGHLDHRRRHRGGQGDLSSTCLWCGPGWRTDQDRTRG